MRAETYIMHRLLKIPFKNKHATESISRSHENKESEMLSKHKNKAEAGISKGK